MSLVIDIFDETDGVTNQQTEEIKRIVNFSADKLKVEDGSEVSITFVTNERIQEINREYRNKDSVTDVISFALEEVGEGEVELTRAADMPRILGDIVISVARAKEQADEYGHSFIREFGFLAVHGFLHLLGFDHMTEEEEKEMFTLQKEILDEYGLKR
jgi:probable rRNA maturation factor